MSRRSLPPSVYLSIWCVCVCLCACHVPQATILFQLLFWRIPHMFCVRSPFCIHELCAPCRVCCCVAFVVWSGWDNCRRVRRAAKCRRGGFPTTGSCLVLGGVVGIHFQAERGAMWSCILFGFHLKRNVVKKSEWRKIQLCKLYAMFTVFISISFSPLSLSLPLSL